MYSDERVASFIAENFLPERVHVRHQAEEFQRLSDRFDARWTPTILVLDPSGTERHRIEGFVESDALLAQLSLGLGHLAFKAQDWDAAAKWFDEVQSTHGSSESAPEAQYWAGVARYKSTGDNAWLRKTAAAFDQRFSESSWARKAAVWKG